MHALRRIYTISFLYYLGFAATAYLNATFLATIFEEKEVGFLFAIGSLVTLGLLEIFPQIVAKIGGRRSVSLLASGSILGLLLMIIGQTPVIIGVGFALFIGSSTVLVSNLDLLITHYGNVHAVGKTRGTYLTIVNIAWMLTPVLASRIAVTYGFTSLFGIVIMLFIFVGLGVWFGLRNYQESKHTHTSLLNLLKTIGKHRAIQNITMINLVLQFFYALMIMYTPFYLKNSGGFDTATIGVILTIMLVPFVLLDKIAGRWADNWKHGEKKLLIIGFSIMSLATIAFGTTAGGSFLLYALILFCTRVGASLAEVASESYFFKQVTAEEVDAISLFRMMNPIAFLIGPIIGTIILKSTNYHTLFILLGFSLLTGIWYTKRLK